MVVILFRTGHEVLKILNKFVTPNISKYEKTFFGGLFSASLLSAHQHSTRLIMWRNISVKDAVTKGITKGLDALKKKDKK